MKERPILFNGDMVRAILEGRKTQTRRVVKHPSGEWKNHALGTITIPHPKKGKFGLLIKRDVIKDFQESDLIPCPYGKIGDVLWVRETWGVVSHGFDEYGDVCDWIPDRPNTEVIEMKFGAQGYYTGHVIYRADGEFAWCDDEMSVMEEKSLWKPSIHMPKEACRIKLEITDIRVERLQDISEEDAKAEGFEEKYLYMQKVYETAYSQFSRIWESINSPESWEDNPWVWVIEFKRKG